MSATGVALPANTMENGDELVLIDVRIEVSTGDGFCPRGQVGAGQVNPPHGLSQEHPPLLQHGPQRGVGIVVVGVHHQRGKASNFIAYSTARRFWAREGLKIKQVEY